MNGRRGLGIFFLTGIFLLMPQARAEDGAAVSRDGTNIAFSVYGEGEPTLVFIHGWGGDRSSWREQVPYFEKKYTVVTIDLAGHGSSGRTRKVYSMSAFGEDAASVVRALGAKKTILIGHSMGGAVIAEAAARLPDEVIGIVGIDNFQELEGFFPPDKVEEFVRPFKEDFKKTTGAFIREMFTENADPLLVDSIVEKISGADPGIAVSALEEFAVGSFIPTLEALTIPVWNLNADLWPVKTDVNKRRIHSYHLRTIHGVGHFLMLEVPDEFNSQLDDIIVNIVHGS